MPRNARLVVRWTSGTRRGDWRNPDLKFAQREDFDRLIAAQREEIEREVNAFCVARGAQGFTMKLTLGRKLRLKWRGTHRLIPSRYPSIGILDQIAAPEDLEAIFQLEGWTNDRISNELGILHTIPRDEWVLDQPMATVIMGAFCHPRPEGGRFNDSTRGAWYCSLALKTAHAEAIFHRTAELAEIGGWFDTAMQMADYRADFNADFHDIRGGGFARYLDPNDYRAPQKIARALRDLGSNGIVYPSVRDRDGECLACFRPRRVANVKPAGAYEYRWTGSSTPSIRKL